jgi:hypothetical protein
MKVYRSCIGFLVFAVLLQISGNVLAQQPTISPLSPSAKDVIIVSYTPPAGTIPTVGSTYTPSRVVVSQSSNKILLSYPGDVFIDPFETTPETYPIQVQVGPLPAGTYEVEFRTFATNGATTLLGSTTFTVARYDNSILSPTPRKRPFPRFDFTDIWWTQAESGWGISVHVKNDQLFAAWFVYNETGQPIWYTLQGGTWQSYSKYSGKVYRSNGPFYGQTFNPNAVGATQVGSGSLTFTAYDRGTLEFALTSNGVTVKKEITRTPF